MSTSINFKTEIPSPDIIAAFLAVKNVDELAVFLKLTPKSLKYFLFYANDDQKYHQFEIKKRNGSVRSISAPNSRLKQVQRTLQGIFQQAYMPKPSVHGFVAEKGIITNAKSHVRKKILITIDLKDFFPSINILRVRGVFLSHPFNFSGEVSNALAHLCCLRDRLPQGAPTSPCLSNFICRKLDNDFMKMSKRLKVHYTRYADDITISTNLKKLPTEIGIISEDKLELSEGIMQLILLNGFQVNEEKVRFALPYNRQTVTGLVVNKKVNINRSYLKKVRSMLHAWEKFGLTNAAAEHYEKFNPKSYVPENKEISYEKELTGRIGFIGAVRGKNDEIYGGLYTRIKRLAPTVALSIIKNKIETSSLPILLTEGKSDIKHVKAALHHFRKLGLYEDLNLNLYEHSDEDKMSNGELLKFCETNSKGPKRHMPTICLFDRDDVNFIANVTSTDNFYKEWGNNVYSMVLSVPAHREFKEICIEHFYTDAEVKTSDSNGRRIYLSNEFNKDTGVHLKYNLRLKQKKKLQAKSLQIIDNGVMDHQDVNVALSKNKFADYVLNQVEGFEKFNFEHFKPLFDNLQNVLISVDKKNLANQTLKIEEHSS